MKPAPFALRRATSVAEAVDLLAAHGEDAKLIAGGQSLVPLLNMRLARPGLLVDVNGVAGLERIDPTSAGGLRIGALARHTDVVTSPLVRERAPLLAEAASHVGHRAIRNRGTLGGSLAHADPAAELPAVAIALDATLVAAGPAGQRTIPIDDFFGGLFTTALGPDEMLTEIRFPDTRGSGWGFAEVARRPGDFAIAGVAALLRTATGPNAVPPLRLAAFGVGDTPVRLRQAEAALSGPIDQPAAATVAHQATAEVDPPEDVHASAAYRRHLVAVLVEQVVLEAAARLRAERPA